MRLYLGWAQKAARREHAPGTAPEEINSPPPARLGSAPHSLRSQRTNEPQLITIQKPQRERGERERESEKIFIIFNIFFPFPFASLHRPSPVREAHALRTVAPVKQTNKQPMRNPSSGGTKTPCCSKVGLKRGPWMPEEDELLAGYINREGEGRWRTLPKRAGLLRCGKSCRLRWMNYLRPSVKRGQIAPDEEDLILRLHRLLGNRWSLIAGRIPGRTDNEIKNYWNTHLSKKLISQGIDPRTHKPLNPETQNSSSNPPSRAPPSKLAPRPRSPNPSPISSGLEETSSGSPAILKENDQLQSADDMEVVYQSGTATAHGGQTSYLPGAEHYHVMGLRSGHGLSNEEDLNCGGDDVFSSFLNSLINEEAFPIQHQLQQQAIGSSSDSDSLIPMAAAPAFGIGTGWESAIVSSVINQDNNSRRVNDQVE